MKYSTLRDGSCIAVGGGRDRRHRHVRARPDRAARSSRRWSRSSCCSSCWSAPSTGDATAGSSRRSVRSSLYIVDARALLVDGGLDGAEHRSSCIAHPHRHLRRSSASSAERCAAASSTSSRGSRTTRTSTTGRRVYNQRVPRAAPARPASASTRATARRSRSCCVTLSPALTRRAAGRRDAALARCAPSADHIRNDVRLVDDVGRLDDGTFVLVLPAHAARAAARSRPSACAPGVRELLGAQRRVGRRARVLSASRRTLDASSTRCATAIRPRARRLRPR